MYLNKIILVALSVILFSCSKKINVVTVNQDEKLDQEVIDSLFNCKISFDELSLDKSVFRLDYKGEIKTLRANIHVFTDSILIVNINTTFSSQVATIIARNKNITFIDYHERKSYIISYSYLSSKIGFKINFNSLQNLLLGRICLQSARTNHASSNGLKDELILKKYSYNPLRVIESEVHNEIVGTVLVSSYKWNSQFSKLVPKFVQLDLKYNGLPLLIELDNKNYEFSTKNFQSLDSEQGFEIIYLE